MRMTFMLPAFWLAAVGYPAAPFALAAEPQALTLTQALQRTLQHDATLQAFPYQLRMAEAAQLQAAVRPSPELAVTLENVAGSGDSRGLSGAELSLSLSQQIELGQKRERRLELAQGQSQLQRDNYELARLEALANTTEHYLQLLRLQQLRQWAAANISREQALLNTAQLRSNAGTLLDADISRIKLRLVRSKITLADINQAIESRRYRLAAGWNAAPDFARVSGDLAALPQLPPLSILQSQLQHSTTLQRYVTLQRIAQSQLRLTEANSQADIRWSVGLKRNEATNDTSLLLGFSLPLNLTDPNPGQRRAQLAEQQLMAMQQQLSATQLSLLLQQQWLALEQLRGTVQAIDTLLLPEAMQLRQLSLSGYQQGQIDLLSVLSAEEELAQAGRDLIESQSNFHLNLLQLERLTGQPITLNSTEPVITAEKNND
ncbi:TolC family protein [Rheinheimera sp. YQF-2]|uniref:TolC family protein n=1 Tax=Rheinheimera lutimaris TaxID=2740584 RepID=A0A7Y5ASW9_9GAMM|nr:TolC family protein [Rheinheimera lutimaris]NRQ43848.1 TolC family protein [Rheinheimera lutimaris]